jgi:HlyD family secretion protein/epimerase transport system membrane fusion protein
MTSSNADIRPPTSLRPPLLAGTAVALAFFAGFCGWAATAPLAGAAVAPALVAPEGSRKTVQHLEGGIVRRILVHDGSLVTAGQPLVELDDTRVRAEHAALLAEWRAAKASEARLLAEQEGRDRPEFPAELRHAAGDDPALARMLAGEVDRLNTRRTALRDQQAILVDRVDQAEAEITGLEAEIASAHTQLGLIGEEIEIVERLLAKGLERKPRLLGLMRSKTQIEGAIAADRAAIARAGQVIAEARQQSLSLESSRAEDMAAELAETRKSLAGLGEKICATADQLARVMVTAPVDGTVVDVRIKTAGGVIEPGATLLDLVPAGGELLLEARVAPVDIDEVHSGLRAQVHLLAYRSRNLHRIEGEVRGVSADRLEDPATRQPYYLARVAVDRATLPAGIAMTAGMPADVMIVTGERTLLQYLLRPLTDTLRRGLRES